MTNLFRCDILSLYIAREFLRSFLYLFNPAGRCTSCDPHPLGQNRIIEGRLGVDLPKFIDIHRLTQGTVKFFRNAENICQVKPVSPNNDQVNIRGGIGILSGVRTKQDCALRMVFFQQRQDCGKISFLE